VRGWLSGVVPVVSGLGLLFVVGVVVVVFGAPLPGLVGCGDNCSLGIVSPDT
jgi:hypothetical protein